MSHLTPRLSAFLKQLCVNSEVKVHQSWNWALDGKQTLLARVCKSLFTVQITVQSSLHAFDWNWVDHEDLRSVWALQTCSQAESSMVLPTGDLRDCRLPYQPHTRTPDTLHMVKTDLSCEGKVHRINPIMYISLLHNCIESLRPNWSFVDTAAQPKGYSLDSDLLRHRRLQQRKRVFRLSITHGSHTLSPWEGSP